jgi:hypothetical protein
LLHGYGSEYGTYDNRFYSGPLSEYRHDVVLAGGQQGIDGQFDYIGFHAKTVPSAYELGSYGGFATGDHDTTGKPTTGTHLSIESNALNGVDAYNGLMVDTWVAGAQRWDLGTLMPGQSRTVDVLLSVLTGWQVEMVDGRAQGFANGGLGVPGGVGYNFERINGENLYVEYASETPETIQRLIDIDHIGDLTFELPGEVLQLFEIHYDGEINGEANFVLAYDPSLIDDNVDPMSLGVFHWTGSEWEFLAGTVDPELKTVSFATTSLSPFAIGVAAVPEPETYVTLLAGLALLGLARRRQRKMNHEI